jgi:hypothetical protein
MEWIKEIAAITGVSIQSFVAVTGLVLMAVATGRYVLGKKALEQERWWKAVLTLGAMGLGIGGAFLAVAAGLYTQVNPAMTVIVGMFNGTVAIAGHQLLKQIPFLEKILKGITTVLVFTCITSCGTWINDTRTGLLAANAGLNTYDDIAVGFWTDAPTNQNKREDLGISTCASLIVQDQLILAWEVTSAVDKGVKKKKDITQYIGTAITVLDSLEDYLEMKGYPLPAELKAIWMQLEYLNPKGATFTPVDDPLEQCADVLGENTPIAGMSVPWDVIIQSGSELALFLMQIITDSIKGMDVDDDALDTYIRHPLKQLMLYEQAGAE